MRRTRVVLGVVAVAAALSLMPAAGAQAAVPTATCTASSTLQLNLLGAILPSKPACATAIIACPVGRCTYITTAVITNAISINSGVTSTTAGLERSGQPHVNNASCGGFQTCTAISGETIGTPSTSGPAGAAGICQWGPASIAVGLGVSIKCKIELTKVEAVL